MGECVCMGCMSVGEFVYTGYVSGCVCKIYL